MLGRGATRLTKLDDNYSYVKATALPNVIAEHQSLESREREFDRTDVYERYDFTGAPVRINHLDKLIYVGVTDGYRPGHNTDVLLKLGIGRALEKRFADNALYTGYYRGVSVGHNYSTKYSASNKPGALDVEKEVLEISLCPAGKRLGSDIAEFFPCYDSMLMQDTETLETFSQLYGYPAPPSAAIKPEHRTVLARDLPPLRAYVDAVHPQVAERRNAILKNEGYIAASRSHNTATEDYEHDSIAPSFSESPLPAAVTMSAPDNTTANANGAQQQQQYQNTGQMSAPQPSSSSSASLQQQQLMTPGSIGGAAQQQEMSAASALANLGKQSPASASSQAAGANNKKTAISIQEDMSKMDQASLMAVAKNTLAEYERTVAQLEKLQGEREGEQKQRDLEKKQRDEEHRARLKTIFKTARDEAMQNILDAKQRDMYVAAFDDFGNKLDASPSAEQYGATEKKMIEMAVNASRDAADRGMAQRDADRITTDQEVAQLASKYSATLNRAKHTEERMSGRLPNLAPSRVLPSYGQQQQQQQQQRDPDEDYDDKGPNAGNYASSSSTFYGASGRSATSSHYDSNDRFDLDAAFSKPPPTQHQRQAPPQRDPVEYQNGGSKKRGVDQVGGGIAQQPGTTVGSGTVLASASAPSGQTADPLDTLTHKTPGWAGIVEKSMSRRDPTTGRITLASYADISVGGYQQMRTGKVLRGRDGRDVHQTVDVPRFDEPQQFGPQDMYPNFYAWALENMSANRPSADQMREMRQLGAKLDPVVSRMQETSSIYAN